MGHVNRRGSSIGNLLPYPITQMLFQIWMGDQQFHTGLPTARGKEQHLSMVFQSRQTMLSDRICTHDHKDGMHFGVGINVAKEALIELGVYRVDDANLRQWGRFRYRLHTQNRPKSRPDTLDISHTVRPKMLDDGLHL